MNGIEQIKKKVKNPSDLNMMALGGNRALVDQALHHVRTVVLNQDSSGLNHHRFVVEDSDLENLDVTMRSMPFLGSYRLVELHGAEKINDKAWAVINAFITEPCPSTWLVLIFNKIDKKTKVISSLASKELLFDLTPTANDRLHFVDGEAKSLGIVIAPSTAQFLDTACGGDLMAIKMAMEKLSLLGKKDLSVDDIEETLVRQEEYDVFLLARHICEGKLGESLYTLGLVRRNHENAIKFLGILMWQMRTIVHIRSCLNQNMAEWDIRKQVGVFGDRFHWMLSLARARPLSFHTNRLVKLTECDHALKSENSKEPFNFIEKIVYQSSIGL